MPINNTIAETLEFKADQIDAILRANTAANIYNSRPVQYLLAALGPGGLGGFYASAGLSEYQNALAGDSLSLNVDELRALADRLRKPEFMTNRH